MNAIQLATTLPMQRGDLASDAVKTLSRIRSNTDRAIRLVRDLLDFTQARLGGGIRVQPSATDLHALTRQVLDEIQELYRERL